MALWWITIGTLLLGAGSVWAQYGWEARSSEFFGRGNSWWRAAIHVAAGTSSIAVGGLAVTYGWDLKSSESTRQLIAIQAERELTQRRAAMIETLRRELSLNREILAGTAFAAQPDETKESLQMLMFFPRILSSGVNSAIASGIFVPPRDTELSDTLRRFQAHAEQLNARLNSADALMGSSVLIGAPESFRYEVRMGIRDGQITGIFQSAFTRLNELLAQYEGITPSVRAK